MKNKILLSVFLMGCTFFATAQNYNLRVHKNGDVTNQWNTANISSITLDDGTATFTVSGNAIAKAFSAIDSITFYNLNGGDNPGGDPTDPTDPDTIPSHDTTTVDPVSGIHITWNNGAAPTIVNGYASQGLEITANGENVTVNAATGLDDLTYVLDGRSVDGNLVINTDKSLILYMQGLHLHSATGAAIRVVDDHRATIHLATGTTNQRRQPQGSAAEPGQAGDTGRRNADGERLHQARHSEQRQDHHDERNGERLWPVGHGRCHER